MPSRRVTPPSNERPDGNTRPLTSPSDVAAVGTDSVLATSLRQGGELDQ